MNNTLHRSTQNRMISGVCGGIGELLGADPTIIRLVWVILTVITAMLPCIIIYIAASIIIPE